MIRVLTVVSVFVCAPVRLFAQLSDTTRRAVDSVFIQYDRTDSPGCALGIYRDGRIIYARGYGMANLELGIAISPKSMAPTDSERR